MDEKTMVSDTLVGINGELKMFGDMIPQTEEPKLKQTLKDLRNKCEMSQEELYRSPAKEAGGEITAEDGCHNTYDDAEKHCTRAHKPA